MLLKLLKMYIKKKEKETPKLYVEDWLYDNIYKKEVYPLYVITQSSFRYCMQHKLLKRPDVLEFKAKLNECVNLNDYKHEKFKNDAHEIYRKLKSICISAKNMQMLNEYLMDYVKAYELYQKETQPEPLKVYGHLSVVK